MRSLNRDKGTEGTLCDTAQPAKPAIPDIVPREILELIAALAPRNQNERQLSELIDHLSHVIKTLERPLRVGIFEGAFDPPHRGHEETARAALGITDLDLIVVTCYPSVHQWKPNLSPHHHRLEMATACFDGDPFTLVTPLDRRAIESLLVDHVTTGIIGSDTFNRFLEKGRPNEFNTDTIFVSERRDALLVEAPPTLDGRPVLYVGATQLAFNTTSSSEMRTALSAEVESAIPTMMSDRVAPIARGHGLYSRLTERHPIATHPSQALSSAEHAPDLYQGCSLLPRAGLMNGLLSESFIHEVQTPSGETVAFRKTLPPHRAPLQNLSDEVRGLEEFNNLGLTRAKAPKGYLVANPPSLWVERAPGETFASLLTRYERGEVKITDAMTALHHLGATLRDLHQRNPMPFSPMAAAMIRAHMEEVDALITAAPEWQRKGPVYQRAISDFHQSSAELLKSGTRCSLTHGDANCGNFLWDSADKTLWAIDLQRFGNQARTHQPAFPSYEYHQLLSALSYFPNFGFRGTRGGGEKLLDALSEGYGRLPPAENAFFESRWTIQRLLGRHHRVVPPTLK